MDGLLVDSEPLWKTAEKKVFSSLGLNLSDDLLRQVMGFRLNEVVEHWYAYQPWQNPDFEETERQIIKEMELLLNQYAKPLPGVYEVLNFFAAKNIPMAVASSSHLQLIEVVLQKLRIKNYFQIIHSAQFEKYGKPHPGIFLTVADKFKVEPTDCLVFEDSINGVIAAKAARMKCIAIPEKVKLNEAKFAIADAVFDSLESFYRQLVNTYP